MELIFFLVVLGGSVGAADAGGAWKQVAFWPYYAAKKVGKWSVS
jgi:hypothetical protein